MDPVSILGLVGTSVSIVRNAPRFIGAIKDLTSRFKDVKVNLTNIEARTDGFTAVTSRVQKWLESGSGKSLSEAEARALRRILEASDSLVQNLQETTEQAVGTSGKPSWWRKLRFMTQQKTIDRWTSSLGDQENGLRNMLHIFSLTGETRVLVFKSRETRASIDRAVGSASATTLELLSILKLLDQLADEQENEVQEDLVSDSGLGESVAGTQEGDTGPSLAPLTEGNLSRLGNQPRLSTPSLLARLGDWEDEPAPPEGPPASDSRRSSRQTAQKAAPVMLVKEDGDDNPSDSSSTISRASSRRSDGTRRGNPRPWDSGGRGRRQPPLGPPDSSDDDPRVDPPGGPRGLVPISSNNLSQQPEPHVLEDGGPTDDQLLAGNDVHNQNSQGEAALHIAAKRLDLDAILRLTGHGAPVEARDQDGRTPLLSISFRHGSEELSLQAVQILLDAGADILARTRQGFTALHLAVMGGKMDTVKALIKRGDSVRNWSIDTRAEPSGRRSALHSACEIDGDASLMGAKAEIVGHLIFEGADTHARMGDGRTPLRILGDELKRLEYQHRDLAGFPNPSFPVLHAYCAKIRETLRAIAALHDIETPSAIPSALRQDHERPFWTISMLQSSDMFLQHLGKMVVFYSDRDLFQAIASFHGSYERLNDRREDPPLVNSGSGSAGTQTCPGPSDNSNAPAPRTVESPVILRTGRFVVHVRSITGSRFSVDAEETDTVLDLKRKIGNIDGRVHFGQRLIFHGTEYNEGYNFHKLSQLGIRHSDQIQMVWRQPGG